MEIVLPNKLKEIYPFKNNRILTKDGYEMHYIDEGKGEPIIMVHGNPTWSFFYRNLIKGLRGRYRCIVPDHIGCGLSEKPQRYQYLLEKHVNNLTNLVNKLKLESFHLIVHDWGGPIGIGMAQKFPEKLKKIVLLNTAAFSSTKIPLRIALCKNPILGNVLVRGCNAFVRGATRMAVTRPLNSLVKKGFHFPYNNWKNRVGVARFIEDIPLSKEHPSWNMLKQIERGLSFLNDKEILICWGAKDFCFNDYYLKEWLRRFPNAELKRYSQAGHYLLEDVGDEVLESIKEYLIKPTSVIKNA